MLRVPKVILDVGATQLSQNHRDRLRGVGMLLAGNIEARLVAGLPLPVL